MSAGQVVGGYRIIKVLGQGSQGVAFLAEPASGAAAKRRVVLKRLEQGAKSATEMRVMQKMRHPNIVACEDSFVEENMVYLVLQYADGGDLEQHINKCRQAKKNIPYPTVISWFVQLCSALQYCHDNNVVHRDVKTANIYLTSSGGIKLGDFGVAKMLDRNSIAATMVGSPMSLSPEVISGNVYTPASDVWSLGCVLAEMLTLQHPFEVDNFGLLITRVCSGQYNPLPDRVPVFLQNAIKGMLTVDVNERWMISDVLNSDERFRAGSALAPDGLGGVRDGAAASGGGSAVAAAQEAAALKKQTSIEGTISLEAWFKLKEKDLRQISAYLDKHRAADDEVLRQMELLAPASPQSQQQQQLRAPGGGTPEMNPDRAKRMLQSPQAAEKVRSQTPPSAKKSAFGGGDPPSPKAEVDAISEREAKRLARQQQLRDAIANGRRVNNPVGAKGSSPSAATASGDDNAPQTPPQGGQLDLQHAPAQQPQPHPASQQQPRQQAAADAAQQRKKSAPTTRGGQADIFAAVPISRPVPVVARAEPPPVVIPQTRAVAQNAPPQNPKPVPSRDPAPSPTAPQPPPANDKRHAHERQALKDLIREQRAKNQGGVATTDVNVEIVLPSNLRNLPQNKV